MSTADKVSYETAVKALIVRRETRDKVSATRLDEEAIGRKQYSTRKGMELGRLMHEVLERCKKGDGRDYNNTLDLQALFVILAKEAGVIGKMGRLLMQSQFPYVFPDSVFDLKHGAIPTFARFVGRGVSKGLGSGDKIAADEVDISFDAEGHLKREAMIHGQKLDTQDPNLNDFLTSFKILSMAYFQHENYDVDIDANGHETLVYGANHPDALTNPGLVNQPISDALKREIFKDNCVGLRRFVERLKDKDEVLRQELPAPRI
jgi:hypothetical protein